MRASLVTHLATASWAVLTAVALLWPDPDSGSIVPWPDWSPVAAHLIIFFVMAFLLSRSLQAVSQPRPLLTAFLVSFAYGMVLEVAQIAIEGRGAEWLDVGMNGLGGLIGVAVAWLPAWLRARLD